MFFVHTAEYLTVVPAAESRPTAVSAADGGCSIPPSPPPPPPPQPTVELEVGPMGERPRPVAAAEGAEVAAAFEMDGGHL